MKTNLIILSLIVLSVKATFSNDGVYLSRGGMIYPMNETKISIKKEILSFTVREKFAHVDVYFEFFNPENSNRKLTIGFQAPSATGDISPDKKNSNQIKEFKVEKDGKLLTFSQKVAKKEDGELFEPGSVKFNENENGIFVYLFETEFKPGKNIIKHNYSFPASENVDMKQIYNYILTTGSKWANGKIVEFILNIDMGSNVQFFVNDVFDRHAEWMIKGKGKIDENLYKYYNNIPFRIINISEGMLEISVLYLNPDKNIEFGIFKVHGFYNALTDLKLNGKKNLSLSASAFPEPNTPQYWRIQKNAVYARYGYRLKDPYLVDFFSQYEWYRPVEGLKAEVIQLTTSDKSYLRLIDGLEKNKGINSEK